MIHSSFWIDVICIYPDRHRTKMLQKLEGLGLCEGVWFCAFNVPNRKIYAQFRLRVRLAHSSSQYDYVSLLLKGDHRTRTSVRLLEPERGSNYFASLSSVHAHELVWASWSWFGILYNQEPVCDAPLVPHSLQSAWQFFYFPRETRKINDPELKLYP
jgi:hypothetical protein